MVWSVQIFNFDLRTTDFYYLQINDQIFTPGGGIGATFRPTNYFVIKPATQNTTGTCTPINNTTALPESNPLLPDRKTRVVGIGLGDGLGVPLLLALASLAFLLTSSRRVERDGPPETNIGVKNTVEEQPRKDFDNHYEAPGQNEVYEASDCDVVHEAPDGNFVPYR